MMNRSSLVRCTVSMLLAAAMMASTSCIRLDEDHCIVNGGDVACAEDRMCVTEIDEITTPTDQGDGCIVSGDFGYDFDRYFVHVQYGLRSHLGAFTDEPEDDFQSVTGVLHRATAERGLDDACTIDEDVVRSFETQWLRVDEVRDFLDRPTRVRAASARLAPSQVEAIDDFNAAINAWVDECAVEGGG